MCKSKLEFRTHSLVVGLKSLPICLHHNHLLNAREDGGDCCDEAYGLHVVCTAADVRERGSNGFNEGGKLELGSCSVKDVEAPGETEEGDGKVHGGGVEGVTMKGINIWKVSACEGNGLTRWTC